MAVLTANYDTADKRGIVVGYNVQAATKIFAGALVAIDASGFLVNAADAAGLVFAGVAYESGDNSVGAAGAVGVRVQEAGTVVVPLSGTWGQGVVGKKAFCVDNNTVAVSGTANSLYVGDVVALVAGGKVRVRVTPAAV